MSRLLQLFRVPALALAVLSSACGLNPVVVGPPGLQAGTAGAPQCGPQQYPFDALANHVEGEVAVRVAVAPAGAVTQAVLAGPAVQPHLDAAALRAVRSCRFAPEPVARQLDLLVVYAVVSEGRHLPNGVVRIGLLAPGR